MWAPITRTSMRVGLATLKAKFPELNHNIAYDRMARNWNAWCTTGDGKIVGAVGIGATPSDAADSLCIYYDEQAAINTEKEQS